MANILLYAPPGQKSPSAEAGKPTIAFSCWIQLCSSTVITGAAEKRKKEEERKEETPTRSRRNMRRRNQEK
jgi:hypothetical protein